MSYYVSYDDKTKNQKIMYYSKFDDDGMELIYSGTIGELLVDFINLDLHKYDRAFKIIQDRFQQKIYTSNEEGFWHDARYLEYFLTGSVFKSFFGEEQDIKNFCESLFDAFMAKHKIKEFTRDIFFEIQKSEWKQIESDTKETLRKVNSTKENLNYETSVNSSEDLFKITKQPKHLYIETIKSEAYIEYMHLDPYTYLIKTDYQYLQKFYFKAIELCFNINQNQDLDQLSKIQRLYLFSEIYDKHLILPNKFGGSYNSSAFNFLFFNIPNINFSDELDLNEDIHLTKKVINKIKSSSLRIEKHTLLSDPYTSCYLEFMKLLESDINIKKCKNCNKLFVVAEGYNVEYCNRIPNGESKTCREIGAVRNYAKKVKNDPVLETYNRSYKTHFARIRYGKMTQEEFNSWALRAKDMKEQVKNGKLSFEEYKTWLKE